MSEHPIEVHPAVATWAAKVAEALNGVGDCETDHGTYYLGAAPVMFDNEPTEVSVGLGEFGYICVLVAPPAKRSDRSAEEKLAELRTSLDHFVAGITRDMDPLAMVGTLRSFLERR
ncbi:hypothetical protein [Ornithinimicrobium murale]|uniref:hypothetical protein n=1 Tax=Ornithinimicrobium murale TaxID=1050153 RepID=UPI000E0CF0A6|nr:hypothetical protein [Ornithinimicrobium murale]